MTIYDTILKNLVERIELSGRCSIEPASDMMIKLMAVAREFELLYDKLDNYEKQLFPDTADGEFLKKHGEAKGIFKKGASKSTGLVTFKAVAATSTPIVIPAGTLVGCSGVADVTFATNSAVTLPANSLSVQAEVSSVETGAHTAVSPLMVNLIITPISGIKEVNNSQKISGGSDGESDDSYRIRVIEGYKKISNGCNLNYYEQIAKSVDGVWFAKAIYKTVPTNQIALYIENDTRTISASKIAEVQQIVNATRELGIKVVVQAATKQAVDVDILLMVDNLTAESSYSMLAEQAIATYISELTIGEAFSIVKLGAKLLTIPGIVDVEFTEPAMSVLMTASQIANIGDITVGCA